MESSSTPIIAVIGATGNQGSSVASTFLSSGKWHVRCLTRDPSSPASRTLASKGAEVLPIQLSEPDTLRTAFSRATVVFANTDFWETYRDPTSIEKAKSEGKTLEEYISDIEIGWGRNIAIAAAEIDTLKIFVYSALAAMKDISKGKYPNSMHWNNKAAIVKNIRADFPELAKKMSLFIPGAYMQMLHWNPMMQPYLSRDDKGLEHWTFSLPMTRHAKMPFININRSAGILVYALITSEPVGTNLMAYDVDLSWPEVAGIFSRSTGLSVIFVPCTIEEIDARLHMGREFLEAPAFISEYGYIGGEAGEKVIRPEQLKDWETVKGRLTPMEEFVKGHDWIKTWETTKNPMS